MAIDPDRVVPRRPDPEQRSLWQPRALPVAARALAVAASCRRRRRAPGASSALRKLYVRFLKFKMEVRVFFYRAPRRPLQHKSHNVVVTHGEGRALAVSRLRHGDLPTLDFERASCTGDLKIRARTIAS